MRLILTVLVLVLAVPAHVQATEYPLDEIERRVPPTGRLQCPDVAMSTYRGEHIRYHRPVRVYEGFIPHLARFERIAAEVATELYGRAPRRIAHLGTFNCRRIRKLPGWLSEHTLGNAIDVEGFDFGPAKGAAHEGLPRQLRRGFKVRVLRHWNGQGPVDKLHSEFLRRLTDRLLEDDVFRVMLGPAYPGHANHFHFDMAPYELIEL